MMDWRAHVQNRFCACLWTPCPTERVRIVAQVVVFRCGGGAPGAHMRPPLVEKVHPNGCQNVCQRACLKSCLKFCLKSCLKCCLKFCLKFRLTCYEAFPY